MSEQKVVLVTGVAGFWGGRVAAQLVSNPDYIVLGVDSEPPKEPIKGVDFIQADIRNPLLVDLLKAEGVQTVVHLAFMENRTPNENAFDHNVMGTMKVFGSCAHAGVEKIVLRSSTAVYGALQTNSAFLGEDHPLRGSPRTGYTRDLVEIEAFCNGFRRQAPEITLTVLRMPNIIGPTVDSPMTRFLRLPISPVLLGFEPQMQFLHESDAVDALIHAVNFDHPGVFNVAAEGVVALDKVMALTGRLPMPIFHLFAYWGVGATPAAARRFLPFEWDYLRYPWVGDLKRMHEDLEFFPKYTAEEALREFAGHLRTSNYKPETPSLSYDEERLRDTIDRRERTRQRSQPTDDPTPTTEEE